MKRSFEKERRNVASCILVAFVTNQINYPLILVQTAITVRFCFSILNFSRSFSLQLLKISVPTPLMLDLLVQIVVFIAFLIASSSHCNICAHLSSMRYKTKSVHTETCVQSLSRVVASDSVLHTYTLSREWKCARAIGRFI